MTALSIDEEKRRSKDLCKNVVQFWKPIDALDKKGLMLRYPLGHPDLKVPRIPNDFADHCQWPLQLRKLIASICDTTIQILPESRSTCIRAFQHLRVTAAAGYCMGDFSATQQPEDEWDDFQNERLKPVSHFEETENVWICSICEEQMS